MDVHVGCCGFPMGRAEYFRHFRVVEVQQTFYQPPRIDTLKRWRTAAPRGFEFTLKAWQLITHEPASPTYRQLRTPIAPERGSAYGAFRPTPEVFDAWQTTLACARALEARIVVFQSPASFAPTAEHLDNLRRFFRAIRPWPAGLLLTWEPRRWPAQQAQGLCDELGLLRVVDPFGEPPPQDGLRYFRLHGLSGYNYRYSDADLERLGAWCSGETYCLFNNTHMAEDAQRFQRLHRSAGSQREP
jgi:uncharacterized protein YecE (DUF72 family)